MASEILTRDLKHRCYECGREGGEEDFVEINGDYVCRTEVNNSCLPEYLDTLPERR